MSAPVSPVQPVESVQPVRPVVPWRARLGAAAAVLAAAGLALTPAPAWLRAVLCLPVLVGVVGHSAARLLAGRIEGPPGAVDAVLGLIGLGAIAIVLHLTGYGIHPGSVAVGTAALALVLLAIPGGSPAPLPLPRPAAAAGAVAALAVLGLAITGAIAMAPTAQPAFTQLALADPGVVAGGAITARPGAEVTVRWTLAGSHLQVTGVTAPGLTGSDTATTGAGTVAGTTRLTAPTTPGLWSVPITVRSTSDAGTTSDQLVVNVRVTT